jgi:hypothetical protein
MKKKESNMKTLNYSEMMAIRGGVVKPKKPKSPDGSIILV